MITILIIYCLVASTLKRVLKHGKIAHFAERDLWEIACKSGAVFAYRLAFALVLLFELADPAGLGLDSWLQPSRFHNWIVLNACVLLVLLFLKNRTYNWQLDRATIPVESIRQVNMRPSLVLNSLFYGFVLLSPTLPFVYGLSTLLRRY